MFSQRLIALTVITYLMFVGPFGVRSDDLQHDLLNYKHGKPPDDVRWGKGINGIFIGIRKPVNVIYLREGKMDIDYEIEFWLRNNSPSPIKWSNSRMTWNLNFSSPGFDGWDEERRYTILPPSDFGKPLNLDSKESVKFKIKLSSFHFIWPKLPSGEYHIQVAYDPERIRNLSIGGRALFTELTELGRKSLQSPKITVTLKNRNP